MSPPLLLWDVYRQLDVVAKIEGDIAKSVPLRASGRAYRPKYKHPRSRKLWIKSRSLEGLPQFHNDTTLSNFYRNTSWRHWALEVGPWTIEVALEGKMLSRMTVRLTHHTLCHDAWENEESRVCVGETTMNDEHIDLVRQRVAQTTPTYDLQAMNCQTVSATLAVLTSDDGWQTWDSLKDLDFFNNIQSLFVPLINLQYNYESGWRDPRMFQRRSKIAKALRKQMQADTDPDGDKSARNAVVVNSLIGNFHSWSAMVRNHQEPIKSHKSENEDNHYPLAKFMNFVEELSKGLLKLDLTTHYF
ncbi:MAG: hypothetical protein Q9167_003132 [Letrouitia subvulpina]